MKTKKLVMLLSVCAMSMFALTAHAEGTVAKIGNTEYATLDEAFIAAPGGVPTEVTLIEDILNTATIKVPEGKNVTLDLAGHTLEAGITPTDSARHYYAIDNFGTLTIKDSAGDGLIKSRGTDNYGTMTIESGTIQTIDSNGGGACVWNEGDLTITGGRFEVTGSKSGNNAAACIINATHSTSIAKITGGEFISNYLCFVNNIGTTSIKDITINKPDTSDTIFMTILANGGNLLLDNVTINAKNGGAIEVYHGNAEITNCNITVKSEYNSYHPTCVASSGGSTVNINGGTYTSDKYGLYVFNTGGTINVDGNPTVTGNVAALKADYINKSPSFINIYSGTFNGTIQKQLEDDNLKITANGGKFSDTKNLTLGEGKSLNENNEVVDNNVLTRAVPFTNVDDNEVIGHFFNVTTAADGKEKAIATIKDGDKTKTGILILPNTDGNGNISFSILVLGASADVTGTISYQ